jgi:hypothetical protein
MNITSHMETAYGKKPDGTKLPAGEGDFLWFDNRRFAIFAAMKLVPAGTWVEVGEQIYEIARDMGFYVQSSLRLMPVNSGNIRFPVGKVKWARMFKTDFEAAELRLSMYERQIVAALRKVDVAVPPLAVSPAVLEKNPDFIPVEFRTSVPGELSTSMGLPPAVELALVEYRCETFSKRLADLGADPPYGSGALKAAFKQVIAIGEERIKVLGDPAAASEAAAVPQKRPRLAPVVDPAKAAVVPDLPVVEASPKGRGRGRVRRDEALVGQDSFVDVMDTVVAGSGSVSKPESAPEPELLYGFEPDPELEFGSVSASESGNPVSEGVSAPSRVEPVVSKVSGVSMALPESPAFGGKDSTSVLTSEFEPGNRYAAFKNMPDAWKVKVAETFVEWLETLSKRVEPGVREISCKLVWEDNMLSLLYQQAMKKVSFPMHRLANGSFSYELPVRHEVVGFEVEGFGSPLLYYLLGPAPLGFESAFPAQVPVSST